MNKQIFQILKIVGTVFLLGLGAYFGVDTDVIVDLFSKVATVIPADPAPVETPKSVPAAAVDAGL